MEKRFLVKNKNWKSYLAAGEDIREGTIPTEVNVFITEHTTLGSDYKRYLLNIDGVFNQGIPNEEWEELQKALNNKARVKVKVISISGNLVKAELNVIKGTSSFSYLILEEDAEKLLKICTEPVLTYSKYEFGVKKQYWTDDYQIWWIKEYSGPYTGLVLTGVEIKNPSEELTIPDWAGSEIAQDQNDIETDMLLIKPSKIQQVLANSKAPAYKVD
jgi:CYTH domain-containing protein